MFTVGDVFVYGSSGVCRISEIRMMECGREKKEYYVLSPVFDERSKVFIPTESEKLASHLHTLLSVEQVYQVIDSMKNSCFEWIVSDKERSEKFRNVLEIGEHSELAKLIGTLRNRKNELAQRGKKLRSSDEIVMQRAQSLLYGEFAYVLGIEPSRVVDFIRERTDK